MCAAAVAPPAHPLSSHPIPLALQVPYCSGDLHLGTQSETNADGVRFAGHHIVGGILGTAAASLGLADATDVLFTGESAGGIGCVAHTDYVAAFVANVTRGRATTVSAPIGTRAAPRTARRAPRPGAAPRPRKSSVALAPTLRPTPRPGGYYYSNAWPYNGTDPPPSSYIPQAPPVEKRLHPSRLSFGGAAAMGHPGGSAGSARSHARRSAASVAAARKRAAARLSAAPLCPAPRSHCRPPPPGGPTIISSSTTPTGPPSPPRPAPPRTPPRRTSASSPPPRTPQSRRACSSSKPRQTGRALPPARPP